MKKIGVTITARARHTFRPLTAVTVALTLNGCAAGPHSMHSDPNLSVIAGTPSPQRGQLYARCIAQAVEAGAYDQTSNSDTCLLRFTCHGAPARAFFDELQAWSVVIGSEWLAEGRTWRSAQKVMHNLFGVDYCSALAGGEDATCVVVLNVGQFLAGQSEKL